MWKVRDINKLEVRKLTKKISEQGNTSSGLLPLVCCLTGQTMEQIEQFLETAHLLTEEELKIAAQKFKFWVMGGNHYITAFKECKDTDPLRFKFVNCCILIQIPKKFTPLIRKVMFNFNVSFCLVVLVFHLQDCLLLAGVSVAQLVQRELPRVRIQGHAIHA